MESMEGNDSMKGIFITGTNTEVGKTYVAAAIARQLHGRGIRVGVYKPVASGCPRRAGEMVAEDAVALWEGAGRPGRLEDVTPQKFAAPLAPHLAAAAEGKRVDEALLVSGLAAAARDCEIVLIEGAGGLMSPISDAWYNADLAERFGIPLIVVAPNELGAINQTLQTLITATTFKTGLPVAGVVLNDVADVSAEDVSRDSNRQEIEARAVPPLLAAVTHGGDFDIDVPWERLAGPFAERLSDD